MHKFFDYLAPDLPVKTIGELAGYIRRFAALFSGGVPVEGHMGGVAFCATEQPGGGVRVHWVQVDRQRIPVDATVCRAFLRGSCPAGKQGDAYGVSLFPLRFRQHGSIIYLI